MKQLSFDFALDVLPVGTKVRVKSKSVGSTKRFRVLKDKICQVNGYMKNIYDSPFKIIPKDFDCSGLVYLIADSPGESGDFYLRKDLEVI